MSPVYQPGWYVLLCTLPFGAGQPLLFAYQRSQIVRQIIRFEILPNKRTIVSLLIDHIDRGTMVDGRLLLLCKHTIGAPDRRELGLCPNQEVPVVLHIMIVGELGGRRLIVALWISTYRQYPYIFRIA